MSRKASQAIPNRLLRQARLERGWTQKDVANRIGAPQDLNVTRWERGTARPSAYYVQKLCELFGKSASELGLVPPPQEPEASKPEPERLWNVPFRRNPYFTGRTQLFETLHEQFGRDRQAAPSQLQALTGLGGIGKTQIAVEYAYRYRGSYQAIFWVGAASRETLAADFVALAHLLKLPGWETADQALLVAAVKRWLARHEDWLLVLDNADDLHLVAEFLPTVGQGHILLTTRAQATGSIANSLAVEKMESHEGTRLLLRRAKLLAPDAAFDSVSAATLKEAQTLVQVLDGLPLALDQAGAYIEETGCNLLDYLALYKRHRSRLLERQSSISTDYPHTVASTWSLSFRQVEQANPAAAELLRLCAFLDPDAILEETLSEGSAELGPILAPVAADPFLLNEAIQVLRRFSLVKRDSEARLLNIHRLVQVVVRDNMDEGKQRQWAQRTIQAVAVVFPEVSFNTWQRCERGLPQALACAALIEQFGFASPEAANVLERAGRYMSNRGRYGPAEMLLQRALSIREQTSGSLHPDVASILHDLALLYDNQGKHEQAEAFLRQVLVIREQLRGRDHPDTAGTLNELANVYMHQGKYVQAEPLLQRALSIREQAFGPEDPDIAESLNDLAVLCVYQGKYEQAEQLYVRALSIREQVLESDHPHLATSLNNLAWLYNYQGRYEQAEPLYLRAIAMFEQALEPTHPDIATCLNNLAELYRNQGKHEQAEPLCLRALSIHEQVLEPNNPYIAACLNNLAEIYRNQGKYEQAEPLYVRALSIREQGLGPIHPRVAQSLNNLAELYCNQEQYGQAEPLYQRALAICEQTLGLEHPDTIRMRAAYASLRKLQEQGKGNRVGNEVSPG